MKPVDLALDKDIVHLTDEAHASLPPKVHAVRQFTITNVANAFRNFASQTSHGYPNYKESTAPITAYEHYDMPGRFIYTVPQPL